MGKRRKGREILLQALYAAEVGGFPLGDTLADQLRRREAPDETSAFAARLGRLAAERLEETDRWLAALVEHWDPERVGQVERAILRLALTELRCCPEVPFRVVINEACELARRFAAEDAVAFINGVLDRAASQVQAADDASRAAGGAAAGGGAPGAGAAGASGARGGGEPA